MVGRTIAELPELKGIARELLEQAKLVCEEVNRLTLEEQEAELLREHPEALEGRKVTKEERKLPPLPNADSYATIVTRFAPNPDSVLHVGSTRAIILNHDYARMYGGKFILRYEDTDPRLKKSALSFYQLIREDLDWLGCTPDEVYIQSDRMDVYYSYAEDLLKMGGGYVCTCSQESFHHLASAGMACPCRDAPAEEQLRRWRLMLDGGFGEGQAVMRVKTDLSHPNPAVRDWPAMRIIDTSRHRHPRTGSKYRVWPLYNWSAGLDDHLMGITHIIRGKEHYTNMVRQKYLYRAFGWRYPEAIHYGRLKIEGGVLSKSKIEAGLRQKLYTGYDDPRLATLRALRRRGISPEAIRKIIYEMGPKPIDATISWDNLLAANRQVIDRVSPRYFAIMGEPVPLFITGLETPIHVELPKHPDAPGGGKRSFHVPVSEGRAELWVSDSDVITLTTSSMVRLMGLMNVGRASPRPDGLTSEFLGFSVEEARRARAPAVHWLVPHACVPIEVMMADATTQRGVAERALADEGEGVTVQLERLFFARVDAKTDGRVLLYFTSR